MLDHHIRVKGVGMVVVELRALFIAQLVVALIVVVVAQNGDIVAEAIDERLDQGGFSAAGASGNADYDHIRHSFFPFSLSNDIKNQRLRRGLLLAPA